MSDPPSSEPPRSPATPPAPAAAAEVIDAAAFEPPASRWARFVQQASARLLSRTGALLYQITMALTLGALIGTTVALVLYGEKSLEILLGGVGGIAVVSGLLRWVVAAVPELDDAHEILAAKRRVFIFSFAATFAVFLGHRWAIENDLPLIPLGADTQLARRVLSLEDELAQLRGELGLRPFRRQFQSALPWARSWIRIPAQPSKYYDLRLEMVDPYRRARLEIVVVDQRGNILGGRRFRADRGGSLIVRATDEWSLHVGIRWWPQDTGPLAAEALALLGDGPRPAALAPADLQITALEVAGAHGESQVLAARAQPLSFDADRELSTSRPDAPPTQALRSRCGGATARERVFAVDVPELAWVRLAGETAIDQPVLISAYASDNDNDNDNREGEDAEARSIALGEIACDASAVLGGRDTNTLTSELELLLPADTYHVALDGFAGGDAAFSLRGAYVPLASGKGGLEVVGVHEGVESGRLVDLLRARAIARCGGDEVRAFDLEVRAPTAEDGAVVTASLSPLAPGDRGDGELIPRRVFDPTQPRLLWLPGAEGFSTDAPICGQSLREASNQAATTIPPGGAGTLRIIAPASAREPEIQALVLRVQHPASPELRAACADAHALDLPPLGAYASEIGGAPSSERRDVFAVTECRAGGLFRPPVDLGLLGSEARATAVDPRAGSKPGRRGEGARVAQALMDLPPGTGTPETLWRVTLPEPAVLNTLVVPAAQASGHYYTTILSGCQDEPRIWACRHAAPPDKAKIALTLPAGEYTIIVDGEGPYFLAYGTDPIEASERGAAAAGDPDR